MLERVQEAVLGEFIVAEFKVVAPSESGALTFPTGCSYSNETRQAVFNRNRAGSSFGDLEHNYRHVCTSDEADMKLVAGHSKPKPHKATHAASAAPICPKPAKWCVHVGATNEPQHCDGVPGHFCHDIFGKSGFKPCDEKITPTWGHAGVGADPRAAQGVGAARRVEAGAAAAANDAREANAAVG